MASNIAWLEGNPPPLGQRGKLKIPLQVGQLFDLGGDKAGVAERLTVTEKRSPDLIKFET